MENFDIKNIPTEYQSLFAALNNRVVTLTEEVNMLRRKHFGVSSERIAKCKFLHPEGTLFNEVEDLELSQSDTNEADTTRDNECEKPNKGPKERSPRSGGRKPLPENLPTVEVRHELAEEDRINPATGEPLQEIGQRVVEVLEYSPGHFFVKKHIYPKYASSNKDAGVVSAPAQPSILPKSQCGPSVLAHIICAKFQLGLPLYRIEQFFSQDSISVTRADMARWSIKGYEFLVPLLELMKTKLHSLDALHCDETHTQVLSEKNKPATSKSYVWTACSCLGDPHIVWYEYHDNRSKKSAADLIGSFKGIIHVDGYTGYNEIIKTNELIRIGCWAHCRRKFEAAYKSGQSSKRNLSHRFVKLIGKLFKVEKEAEGLTYEQVVELRKSKSVAIMNEIRHLMLEYRHKITPTSMLGKAIAYLENEWDSLQNYLHHGKASISNNRVENFIRPFVIGRKGWLFSESIAGAKASAAFYSLVVTARANGLVPYQYLLALFDELPLVLNDDPKADLTNYLPWIWKPNSKHSPLKSKPPD